VAGDEGKQGEEKFDFTREGEALGYISLYQARVLGMPGPRATVVVVKDGKILLVRDKGQRRYSLPGEGIHRGEPSISADARELYEETGFSADKIERVLTYQGATRRHAVFLITAHHRRVRLKSELDALLWWDRKTDVPAYDHISSVLDGLTDFLD